MWLIAKASPVDAFHLMCHHTHSHGSV
jgi:hypothetical protein